MLTSRVLIAAGGGVVALAVLVLLGLMLNELSISRQRIEAQDAKAASLRAALDPVLNEARPVLRESDKALRSADELVPKVREASDAVPLLAQTVATTLDSAKPVLDELASSDLSGSLDAVVRLTKVVAPAVSRIDTDSLERTIAELGPLLTRLRPGRLDAVTRDGAKIAHDARRRELVRRLDRATGDIAQLLAIQRVTKRLQARSLKVQRRSFKIQKQTLKHAASLDRKTGGTVAP